MLLRSWRSLLIRCIRMISNLSINEGKKKRVKKVNKTDKNQYVSYLEFYLAKNFNASVLFRAIS